SGRIHRSALRILEPVLAGLDLLFRGLWNVDWRMLFHRNQNVLATNVMARRSRYRVFLFPLFD
ncbi:MAG TPA: hypothetical protein VLS27_16545, partial [Gammaproteobacteria bacterium]|nr:hypothetical protein [Gammaproteobacteria bacterium]